MKKLKYEKAIQPVKKDNIYNYAELTNISGPDAASGTMFTVYSGQGSSSTYKSRVATISYTATAVTMYYDLSLQQITDYLYGEQMTLYAKLAGYPRYDTATLRGKFTP